MADEQSVAFEFREDFDFEKLKNCAIDEKVFGREFICRHENYFSKWRLGVQQNAKGKARNLGFYLYTVDQHPEIVMADVDLFVWDNCLAVVLAHQVNVEFKKGKNECGRCAAFVASVASLKKKGLAVDGVVKLGVNIVLKASDFNPLKWLPLPPLTPKTDLGLMYFNNLGTGNRLGTDFVIVVGKGDEKQELPVSRLALTAVPFFHRMFGNSVWMANQNGAFHMPTQTTDAVIEALRFIYVNEVGQDLTRFLPSVLALASEWELDHFMTAIEQDMVRKLNADQSHEGYDLAADYLELTTAYDRKIVASVATCKLMDSWPQFLLSPKCKSMKQKLMDQVTCVMAATAIRKGDMNSELLISLPFLSLTPDMGRTTRQLFANLGTNDRRGTDFVIIIGEGESKEMLHVNSLALSVVPFFDRIFADDESNENQTGVLHLPTHTVDAVMVAIRFVYLNEVGQDLTRFLPSVLSLASEWGLNDLMTAIEREMIKKVLADRFNYEYELAADYLELADEYDLKMVGRLTTFRLISAWPAFIRSQKSKDMKEALKDKVTRTMAEIAGDIYVFDQQ